MSKLVTLEVKGLGTIKTLYNDTVFELKNGHCVNVVTDTDRLVGIVTNIEEADETHNDLPVIEAEDITYFPEKPDYWLEVSLENKDYDIILDIINVIEPNGQTHQCVWLEDDEVNIGDTVAVYVDTDTYINGVVYNKQETSMSKTNTKNYTQAYHPVSEKTEENTVNENEMDVLFVQVYIPSCKREEICLYSTNKPMPKECDKVVVNTNYEETIGIVLNVEKGTVNKDKVHKYYLAKEYFDGIELWNPYEDEEAVCM